MVDKVTLIGLKNNNLGDIVILDTCKYLVRQLFPNAKISVQNIFPETIKMKDINASYPKINLIIEKIASYTYFVQILNFVKWWISQKRGTSVYKYYKRILKRNSKVIFAGGGLIKFSREDLWNPIYSIITYCQRKRIPVYFNAVGVEGYDEKDFYSQLLKYSLNKSCVKKITTRDDIDSLNKYVKDKDKISLVGDPALWTKETYNVEDVKKTDIIGVGVIRGKIFTDYGFDFSEEQIVNSYVNIIRKLEEKGYKWQMFCNGAKNDYKMGKNILEKLGLPESEEYLAPRPRKAIDLVKQIYSYKATISARLHANIIAVSYEIPTIGIVWNNKLKLFGKIIGCPERFIENEKFSDADFVVSSLESAVAQGYDNSIIETLKLSTLNSISENLELNLLGNKTSHPERISGGGYPLNACICCVLGINILDKKEI